MELSPAGHCPELSLALILTLLLALLLLSPRVHADDPYARSRDYDLQNVRTHLRFDLEQKKIRGEVSHLQRI